MADSIDTGLTLRLEATLARFEKQMAKARAVAGDASKGIETRFDALNQRMAKSAEASAAALTRHLDRIDDGYRSVLHSVDPLAAASDRLAAQERKVAEAFKYGTISATEHARVLALLKAQHAGVSTAATAAGSGVGGFMKVSNAGRFVLQNTAAQLGDVAVQLEMGTSPARVMAQQLPQLFGGFGALGGVLGVVAPLLGVVAAVGIPVAAMFLNMANASDEAKEKARTFTEKLNDTEAAIARAGAAAELAGAGGLEDLRIQFGEVSQAVSDLALELYKIEERTALKEIGGTLEDVSKSIAAATEAASSAVGQALASAGTQEAIEAARAYRAEIEAMQQAIDQRRDAGGLIQPGELEVLAQMRAELAAMEGDFANIGDLVNDIGLSPDLLAGLSDAQASLEAAQSASDFSGIADALAMVRDLLQQAGDAISQDVVDGVTRAEEQARKMAKTLDEGRVAAEGIAGANMDGNIANASNEALTLARNLGIALSTAQQIAAASSNYDTLTSNGLSGPDAVRSKVQFKGGNFTPPVLPGTPGGPAIKVSDSSSGRSSRSEKPLFAVAETELQKLERQIELIGKTDSEIAALTLKYKLLDEAKSRGLDLDQRLTGSSQTLRQEIDARSAAIARMTEEYERAELTQKQFEQGIDDIAGAMAGALVKGESFRESMKSIFEGLAYDILKSGIREAIMGVFSQPAAGSGGGGGFLSSIFGGLFGGKRAGGGSVQAGRAYMVNENTRNSEIFVPSKSGAILNTSQAKNALRGAGGAAVRVIAGDVTLSDDGRIMAQVQVVAENKVKAGLQQVPSIMDDHNKRSR